MIIAVDFDGTIVRHRYPAIGEERKDAVKVLRQLQADGHTLVLWSVREGELLDEALAWCRQRGIHFAAANSNVPQDDEQDDDAMLQSRKLNADIFIDDKNIGGIPSWRSIYEIIARMVVADDVNSADDEEEGGSTDEDEFELPYPAWMFWKRKSKNR